MLDLNVKQDESFVELEAKAIAEVQEVVKEVAEVLPVGFWVKYRVELIVAALLIASHVAGRFVY